MFCELTKGTGSWVIISSWGIKKNIQAPETYSERKSNSWIRELTSSDVSGTCFDSRPSMWNVKYLLATHIKK